MTDPPSTFAVTPALIARALVARQGQDAVDKALELAGDPRSPEELEAGVSMGYERDLILVEAAGTILGDPLLEGLARDARSRGEMNRALILLSHYLARSHTVEEVTQRLAETVPIVVGGDRSAVLLWDDAHEVLQVKTFHGYTDDLRERLAAHTFTSAQLAELEQAERDRPLRLSAQARGSAMAELMRGAGALEMLIVPVVLGEEPIGFIAAVRSTDVPFPDDGTLDARLSGLADQAATAIEKARLFETERSAVMRLREADMFKDEFLATVSHELRTPLAVLIGTARTLAMRSDQLDEKGKQEFLDTILKRGQQLQRMINDLLHSSRDIELNFEDVNLAEVALAASNDLTEIEPTARIVYTGKHHVPARVDADRVRQVLDNLLMNALKYAPGSEIRIDAGSAPRRGQAWIAVSDDGPGMTPEQLQLVFEPFYQVQEHDSNRAGVGLGLYITRRIAEAHGGYVDMTSSPGAGTKVKVVFSEKTG
ncbi:MAG: GAF domain-containing sensor histidine kinase [Actinomycetota bacterium]|nr:GAF domain-containing sensor histidine kinase [Actinomycetota bacterium]